LKKLVISLIPSLKHRFFSQSLPSIFPEGNNFYFVAEKLIFTGRVPIPDKMQKVYNFSVPKPEIKEQVSCDVDEKTKILIA